VNKKLNATFGLRFNPFSFDIPPDSLWVRPEVERFNQRVESLCREGGFALISGVPGVGKSAALRLLAQHLSGLRDVKVGVLTRPQCKPADFYRELGDLYGVVLSPHNRWAGTKVLRERWIEHMESSLSRPVLIIDEAQEMLSSVLCELRLMMSAELDSKVLLTVVLCGDDRLPERLRTAELLAVGSRVRARLPLEAMSPAQLSAALRHVIEKAGNPRLVTPEAERTLCEHAAGNLRVLFTMAAELLDAALARDVQQIDDKLYLETFAPAVDSKGRKAARKP
jgi:type II secretory pathway predicted ATPase ExeA